MSTARSRTGCYLFKNETHNHPTEIEPFGGAATCVGGAIRDPLSGRSYVYQAMRVTGAADPTVPVADTIPGKLPQRKLVTTAAAGYSSYGNQIGLATGQVHELYHPGYAAKRMEIGAVVGATPADHVRRETPAPGDVVVLLGGRTGRDGIGGATGSSKAHSVESLESCGAEVQKGNAPVERKIQRLFRRGEACRMIKRCNDFGAGGVSVAIGELADGLDINLDAVPKKYDGLDGTELAISESQERMAVALAPEDVDAFIALAHEENLEATPVAVVTEEPRVRMHWRGDTIVDVSREFLASNGAPKHAAVAVPAPADESFAESACDRAFEATSELTDPVVDAVCDADSLEVSLAALVGDINRASNKGLVERFDSTIGAATVLMPFGGARQLTPALAMVAKLPVLGGKTTTVSGLSWGFNPYLSSYDPYAGAYMAVLDSRGEARGHRFRARRTCTSPSKSTSRSCARIPERWGKPMAAVLGALMAQIDFGVGAIGGKDSMSGSLRGAWTCRPRSCPSRRPSGQHRPRYLARAEGGGRQPHAVAVLRGLRWRRSVCATRSTRWSTSSGPGIVRACASGAYGGLAETLVKMSVGNGLGADRGRVRWTWRQLFEPAYGTFVVELTAGRGCSTSVADRAWKTAGLDADVDVVELGPGDRATYALTCDGPAWPISPPCRRPGSAEAGSKACSRTAALAENGARRLRWTV